MISSRLLIPFYSGKLRVDGKPSSVPTKTALPSKVLVGGNHLSWLAVASKLQRPTRQLAEQGHSWLLGLAPDGVYRASTVASAAVGSYPAFSPLPTQTFG